MEISRAAKCSALRSAVEQAVTGAPSVAWPLSALKLHPRATLLTDLDACVLLSGEVKTRLDQARAQDPHAEEWVINLEDL